jgi:hypothetical protein
VGSVMCIRDRAPRVARPRAGARDQGGETRRQIGSGNGAHREIRRFSPALASVHG